jgi:SPP1 gp7 family putative phage head morphogenesis protein
MARRIPKLKSTISDEQRYEASIKVMINDLRKLTRRHVEPSLESIVDKVAIRVDEEAGVIDTAIGKLRASFSRMYSPRDYRRAAKAAADRTNKTNISNHAALMKFVVKADVVKFESWLDSEIKSFVNQNVSLIESLPETTMQDIEQMLYRESRRGLSPKELKAAIKEKFKATDNQAKLIARDQVSKFNGSLTELRQKNAGITHYEWLTSDDGRVRPDHDRLNHTIQAWDSPPITVTTGKRAGERNHPNGDILCRCIAAPIIPKRGK